MDELYIPENSYKPERGGKLPEKDQLLSLAIQYQNNNLHLLNNLTSIPEQQHLLENEYLPNFLLQHYDQHYETMQMALQQRALQQSHSSFIVTDVLIAQPTVINSVAIARGEYLVGSNHTHSYDNEQPQQPQRLDNFSISLKPVTNAEFLAFMQDNAYNNKSLWSDNGWQWLTEQSAKQLNMCPEHWREDKNGHWFGIDNDGHHHLKDDEVLYGINYFEAAAYAKWADARLPHEHEWEVAQNLGLLKETAQAWEWCDNLFYAYAGFKAFPYDTYSLPSFEQAHFVLKGGSRHTQETIKRPSFRNFFGADKRHIFAGLRLAYD